MRVLVTGGCGFIGSNLVKALKDDDVTVVDNLHTGKRENLPEGVRFVEENAKWVGWSGLHRHWHAYHPDVIFHLGMPSSTPMYRDDRHLVSEVVAGAIAIFEFAKENGCPVVLASSSSVYNGHPPPHSESLPPFPTDFYTEARLAVERLGQVYAQFYDMKVASLRLFSVYGKGEAHKGKYANLVSQFLWVLQKGERPVIYGDGNQTRDFTYVDDVVGAFQKAVGKTGVFNVGTGKGTTINQLVDTLNRHLGADLRPEYVQIPFRNYVAATQADTVKATRELGYKASYSLDEGIQGLLGKELV